MSLSNISSGDKIGSAKLGQCLTMQTLNARARHYQ